MSGSLCCQLGDRLHHLASPDRHLYDVRCLHQLRLDDDQDTELQQVNPTSPHHPHVHDDVPRHRPRLHIPPRLRRLYRHVRAGVPQSAPGTRGVQQHRLLDPEDGRYDHWRARPRHNILQRRPAGLIAVLRAQLPAVRRVPRHRDDLGDEPPRRYGRRRHKRAELGQRGPGLQHTRRPHTGESGTGSGVIETKIILQDITTDS